MCRISEYEERLDRLKAKYEEQHGDVELKEWKDEKKWREKEERERNKREKELDRRIEKERKQREKDERKREKEEKKMKNKKTGAESEGIAAVAASGAGDSGGLDSEEPPAGLELEDVAIAVDDENHHQQQQQQQLTD